MPDPTEGTPSPEAQAPLSTPPTTEQPAAAQPTPVDYKAQAEAANLRAQQAEQSARYHQSQADRLRTALGAPNQPDPSAQVNEFAKLAAAKHGMTVEDAKRLIPFFQDLAQPLYQQINGLQASQLNGQAITAAMNGAYQQNPLLFATPGLYEQTEAALRQSIAQNPNPLPVEELQRSALFTAGGLAAMAPKPTGQAAPPLAQPHPVNFRSMTGIQPSVSSPAPVQQSQPTEAQLQMRAYMKSQADRATKK